VLHIFTCNVWPLSTENQKISKKSLKPSSQYSKNICISLDLKKLNFLSNILLAEINLKFQNFCISLDTKWLKENFWLCLKQYIEDTLFRMWDSLWKYFWTVVSNLDLFAVGSLSIPKHKLNIRRYLGLFLCDYSKLAIAKSLKICLAFEGENWAKKGYVAQGVWTAKRSKVLSLEHYHCCIVSGNTLRKHVEKTSWCWLVVILWISSKMTDVLKSP